MSKHQNVLNDVREALIYCASPPGTLPPQNQAQFRIAQDVLARLDAFLADVPGDLGENLIIWGRYLTSNAGQGGVCTVIAANLLHIATTKGQNDE